MNLTEFTPFDGRIPVQECRSWCLDQHFAHDFIGVWFIGFAFASLVIGIFVPEKYQKDCYLFSMYMLIGFFVWFMWLR
jgi:hypothetical protein